MTAMTFSKSSAVNRTSASSYLAFVYRATRVSSYSSPKHRLLIPSSARSMSCRRTDFTSGMVLLSDDEPRGIALTRRSWRSLLLERIHKFFLARIVFGNRRRNARDEAVHRNAGVRRAFPQASLDT